MNKYDIYADIAQRTNGDVYVGVVGPVRCGKSTFISNFMQKFVFPNIKDENMLNRAKDELPQSGDGKLVMTTQPNFVPNEAVKVCINDNISFRIRMIDCVGFMVPGAQNSEEEGKMRMVKTPWSDSEMPFDQASEIGTKKVISEHSNIVIMLTTDGSISTLDRLNYLEAEQKTINELQNSGKPFVIAINSINPQGKECQILVEDIKQKYNAPVVALNAQDLTEQDVNNLFIKVLSEFGVKSVKVNMPMWLRSLDYEDDLIKQISQEVTSKTGNMQKIADATSGDVIIFKESEDFEPASVDNINLGTGEIDYNIIPKPELFYKVISSKCGIEMVNDFDLMSNLSTLARAKKEYDKLKDAIAQANSDGYGIVEPNFDDIVLEEPQAVKRGSKSSVQIKAKAPSLHIMRVDIETEIQPVISSCEQAEEVSNSLKQDYLLDPNKIWQTNMFGKTIAELVSSSLKNKILSVPQDVKNKMKRTMQRVTNEGKGGVLCILL